MLNQMAFKQTDIV